MTTGRAAALLAVALSCAGLAGGCAQPGGILGRRTTIGTLKASVSQLEFEKNELNRQVADLKAENRRAESRLAQEEEANGELTARLDDARVLLRSRGYDAESLAGPASASPSSSDFDDRPRTLPAGRGQRTGRRPPFARIPAHVEPLPNSSGADGDGDDPLETPSSSSRRDDYGPQSRVESGSHWRRVARSLRGDRTGAL